MNRSQLNIDNDFYKVTSVVKKTTKKGDTVYSLYLNNKIWVNYIYPDEVWQSSGYNNLHVDYKINDFWKNNNYSLENLVGNYIAISLIKSKFGIQTESVRSLDIISDFKRLLDESNGKAFNAYLPIYSFLQLNNYKINLDNSITLRKPYSNFDINIKNICYPNNLDLNVLSLDNIDCIYNEFYKDKRVETNNIDRDCHYGITNIAIVMHHKKYHKTKSRTISEGTSDVLGIGDKLSEEHIAFLKSINNYGAITS